MKPKPNSTTRTIPIRAHRRYCCKPRANCATRKLPPNKNSGHTCAIDNSMASNFAANIPIDRFIIDFYCDEAKLCIEVDGDSHAEQIEYDQARTAYLNELGYTVIRFTNREVFNQCEAVLQHIAEECERIVEDAAV